jgi:hypothetical protein
MPECLSPPSNYSSLLKSNFLEARLLSPADSDDDGMMSRKALDREFKQT